MTRSVHITLIGLLALVMVFTSCAKDELVEPCSHSAPEQSADEKALTSSHGTSDPDGAEAPGGRSDEDGSGIGDDGDDLSGSDRGRRKPTP